MQRCGSSAESEKACQQSTWLEVLKTVGYSSVHTIIQDGWIFLLPMAVWPVAKNGNKATKNNCTNYIPVNWWGKEKIRNEYTHWGTVS